MRIAVISRVFSKTGGGAESYSVAIVAQLSAKHEIHVFAQESNEPVAGVTYHRVFCLCTKPRWINQLLFAVATWWRTRKGFDVVHSHENTWHGQVQTVHVRPLRYNLFHGRSAVALCLRWFKVALSPRLITYVFLEGARFAHQTRRHVVATSQTLQVECEQSYPKSQPMLSVITPGTQIPQHPMPQKAARLQLGLPPEGKLVLFVANDPARKGLDALLQAMAQLPADVGLVVVGNPKPIPRYRKLAEQLGVANRVHFLGSLNELAPAYFAANCLAHPTLEDSFAMVVLEAMAHGLPVVVSGPAYCGISQQLRDGAEALLLQDPRDVGGLVHLLSSVLNEPLKASSLRQHGLQFVQVHTWANAASQYEALYFHSAL